MHLWNTKALATELRDGSLSERERMKYYLLFMTLFAVMTELPVYIPQPVTPALIATSVISIMGTVAGIYITYCANSSGDDRDFITRSLCLAFPVGIRVIAASTGIYVAYMIFGSIIGGSAFDRFLERTTWIDVAFLCVVEIVFYWRLWHHITWISKPHVTA